MLLAEHYMNLYLLRHGESLAQTGEETGTDSRLSKKGILQAEAAGEFLRKMDFDAVRTSPLNRTLETLEALSLNLKTPPVRDDDLVENFGGAETILPRVEQLRIKVYRYSHDFEVKNVLFVSHAMFMSSFLLYLLTHSLAGDCRLYARLSNAGIGLLRIPRESGCACVLSGWNLDGKAALEYENVLYP